MITDLPSRRFVRLTNLGNFKICSKESLLCLNDLLSSSSELITLMSKKFGNIILNTINIC